MSENYPQPVKVQYGSFVFPQPTPYVSKTFSNEFVGGNLWSTRVSITLVGKVALLPRDEEGDGNNYLNSIHSLFLWQHRVKLDYQLYPQH